MPEMPVSNPAQVDNVFLKISLKFTDLSIHFEQFHNIKYGVYMAYVANLNCICTHKSYSFKILLYNYLSNKNMFWLAVIVLHHAYSYSLQCKSYG